MGVEPNSVRYEHHNTDTLTSTRENIPNRGVARVVYSYLNLGTSIPNATTSLELSICLGSHINAGDYFLISLPDFKGIAFSIKLAASFFQQSESDTLVFSYQITATDSSSNGLYLYCTCIDFFNRSFISLQGSRIFASCKLHGD